MDDLAHPRVHHGRSPGRGWVPVTHGVYRTGPPDCFRHDLLAWQTVLRPTAAFTHITSARLRGWWLPPLPDGLPVFVSMLCSQNPSQRHGLLAIRHRVIPPSELVDDVRVTTVAETLVECARDLGLIDLVVILDGVLHHELATREEIERVAREHRRGAPLLRRALRLSDARSESPWETLLRLLHHFLGVAVEPQHELFDPQGGFVARADLWLVGTRTIHEYDGGVHRRAPRQRRDLKRDRRLGHARIVRRGYTSEDVLHQPIGILRDADAALGRTHDADRMRPWYELLRRSLFTPAGRARFCDRLGIETSTKTVGKGA